jgi:hypothetical protein
VKTEKLIEMLSTNLEPVRGGELRNLVLTALAGGAIVAFCLMLAIFGVPAGPHGGESFGLKLVALAFTLGLVGASANLLVRLARPGDPGRQPLIPIGLLFLAMLVAGAVVLLLTDSASWGGMIFGPQWAACLICIPLFAIAPFAALVWALRKGAPTGLARTGAIAGLLAGALGAAIFALHHPGGSIPFVILWYGGPIVLCALAGAILGPRLLRW